MIPGSTVPYKLQYVSRQLEYVILTFILGDHCRGMSDAYRTGGEKLYGFRGKTVKTDGC